MITRRHAIRNTAIVTLAAATLPNALGQRTNRESLGVQGEFALPPLPYSLDALEPHIDARTMEIHHGRHHKTYVDNLNKALAESPELRAGSIEDLMAGLNAVPEKIRTAVRNNGGGHYNHSLFWPMMSASGGREPKGQLKGSIDKAFGSFSSFKDQFTKAALGQFGSGWAWLVMQGKELKIVATPNQDNPVSNGARPLLGLDVWEHAYYLKYQNKRADYITAWWNVVNWEFVTELFEKDK